MTVRVLKYMWLDSVRRCAKWNFGSSTWSLFTKPCLIVFRVFLWFMMQLFHQLYSTEETLQLSHQLYSIYLFICLFMSMMREVGMGHMDTLERLRIEPLIFQAGKLGRHLAIWEIHCSFMLFFVDAVVRRYVAVLIVV